MLRSLLVLFASSYHASCCYFVLCLNLHSLLTRSWIEVVDGTCLFQKTHHHDSLLSDSLYVGYYHCQNPFIENFEGPVVVSSCRMSCYESLKLLFIRMTHSFATDHIYHQSCKVTTQQTIGNSFHTTTFKTCTNASNNQSNSTQQSLFISQFNL